MTGKVARSALASGARAITPAQFRERAAELLRELAATDEGQAVVELARWCRRHVDDEDGPAVWPSPGLDGPPVG